MAAHNERQTRAELERLLEHANSYRDLEVRGQCDAGQTTVHDEILRILGETSGLALGCQKGGCFVQDGRPCSNVFGHRSSTWRKAVSQLCLIARILASNGDSFGITFDTVLFAFVCIYLTCPEHRTEASLPSDWEDLCTTVHGASRRGGGFNIIQDAISVSLNWNLDELPANALEARRARLKEWVRS